MSEFQDGNREVFPELGGGGAETNNLEQHTPCLVERKTPLYKEKEYRKPTCLVLPHKCLEV